VHEKPVLIALPVENIIDPREVFEELFVLR
jgi:hypothetical protein